MADGLQASSATAALTAAARAFYRAEDPPPRVMDDWLALDLAGPQGRELFERLRTQFPRASSLAFSRWVCVRARYAEDMVAAAANRGIDQYVILGAGLDSFAYRRDDLVGRLTVFEVDHPATQAAKRARLAELRVELPAALTFVPVDFERQSLRDQLASSGFDFGKPSVVSWIGVTMYLTQEAIDATLEALAGCAGGTRVVLTYNQPLSALSGFSAEVAATFSGLAGELGEHFVSVFLPQEIERVVAAHGFVDVCQFGAEEALATYFGGRSDVSLAGAQRLLTAAVPGRP
jgi:methyltransferase (TIGR00027 family)